MPNLSTRLLTLIMLLQLQPNQKAASLAAELGVSVRTLHRYFEMLDEMGIPIYAERGPYGGFSLVRGYKMPPLVLTPEESVAVALGTGIVEELWGQLYREPARGALAKLENLLPDDQRQEAAWARRSLIATGMHRANLDALAPCLETLRSAVRQQRRVDLVYQGSASQPESRAIDPYALVHRWGWWYVVAFCHLRQGMRTFRVDRMEAVRLDTQLFEVPPDFDVHAYLATELGAQPQLQAQLRFSPQGAGVARYNRANWDDLQEDPDGSVLVTLSVPDLTWAASTVLAYGPLVTVVAPAALRQIVASWAQAVAGNYAEPQTA